MSRVITRDEGRAWVRVALIKSAEQARAEKREQVRRDALRRELQRDLDWARRRIALLEKRAAVLGFHDLAQAQRKICAQTDHGHASPEMNKAPGADLFRGEAA